LTEPVVTRDGSEIDDSPLGSRSELFHPDAFLDRADLAVRYIEESSLQSLGVRSMFAGERDYKDALAVFLFVAGLVYLGRNPQEHWPLYPGFKLIEGSSTAIRTFVSILQHSADLIRELAAMTGEGPGMFKENWGRRVQILNDAELGGHYRLYDWRPVPLEI
jgi:hypothetical protein